MAWQRGGRPPPQRAARGGRLCFRRACDIARHVTVPHPPTQPNATAKAAALNDTLQAKLAAWNASWTALNESVAPKLASAPWRAALDAKLAALNESLTPKLAALNESLAPKLAALNESVTPKLAALNESISPKVAHAAGALAAAASAATTAHPSLAALNETLAAKQAVLASAAATLKAKKRHAAAAAAAAACDPLPASAWRVGLAANNTPWTNFKDGGSSLYVNGVTQAPLSWKIYVLTAPADLCGGAVGATARLTTATAAFAYNNNQAPASITANVQAALFGTAAGAGQGGTPLPTGAPTALSPAVSVTIPKCVTPCAPPGPTSPNKPVATLNLGPDFVIQPGASFAFGLIADWPDTTIFKWANVQVGTTNPAVTGPVAGESGFVVGPLAYTGPTGTLTPTNAINNYLQLTYSCSGGCTPP